MTVTCALSAYYLRPHQSPTAVAYRASAADTDAWIAAAALAQWERKAALGEVADRWRHLFLQVLDRDEAGRVHPHRSVRFPGHRPRRRHRFHWSLWPSLCEVRDVVVPHCHTIPGESQIPAQAPDLRTRIGRSMQADLDTLQAYPGPTRDQIWDLPADGSARGWDPQGRELRRSTLTSEAVAPGCRYVVYEAPPARELDPAVWTPVPVAEYLQVRAEQI